MSEVPLYPCRRRDDQAYLAEMRERGDVRSPPLGTPAPASPRPLPRTSHSQDVYPSSGHAVKFEGQEVLGRS
ncbi:hypothetical protein T484DRAFT_3302803 [Baffinella frigidus]|nr:hypothetical protein T484DRAFT_3302803 [Cryptophyta sp. CCMP2293]